MLAERIDATRAKVLYVSRGHGKKHPEHGEVLPFKEFDVARDDGALKQAPDRGPHGWFCREEGPTRVCTVSWQPEAKRCPGGLGFNAFLGSPPLSLAFFSAGSYAGG